MNRVDYFFKQAVTEEELDKGFNYAEIADKQLVVDQDLVGICAGLTVAEHSTPDLTVDVALGTAYDKNGQHMVVPALENLDCSVDEDAVNTAVLTPGNEKYLSVFLSFDRALSDPRTDGDSQTVYFERAESYVLRVVQGAEATIGSASYPALDADDILLCDVRLINGQTQILNADIETDRTEVLLAFTAGALSVSAKTVKDMGEQILTHVSSISGAAADITYAGGGAWHDTTTNPATSVEAQLDKIISDLAGETSGAGNGGGDMIGMKGTSGSPTSLVTGSVFDQVVALLTAVNARGVLASPNTWSSVNTFTALNGITSSNIATMNGTASDASPAVRTSYQPSTVKPLWEAKISSSRNLRLYAYAANGFTVTVNAVWTGTAWVRDDTGYTATRFDFHDQAFRTYSAVIAAGNITWVDRARLLSPASTYTALELPGSNIPATTAPGANRLYAPAIPKAWVYLQTSGVGAATILDGHNVASATVGGAGNTLLTINFAQNMATANYAVSGMSGVNYFPVMAGHATNQVLLQWYDPVAAGYADLSLFAFHYSAVVHALQ